MLDHDTVVDEKSHEYDPDFIYCLRRVKEITHDENLVFCIDKILTKLKCPKYPN